MRSCCILAIVLFWGANAAAAQRGVHLRIGKDDATIDKVKPYLGIVDSVSVYGGADDSFLAFCRRNGIKVWLASDLAIDDLRTLAMTMAAQDRVCNYCRGAGTPSSGLYFDVVEHFCREGIYDGVELGFHDFGRTWLDKFLGFSRSIAQHLRLHMSPRGAVVLRVPFQSAPHVADALADTVPIKQAAYLSISDAAAGKSCSAREGVPEFWRRQAASPWKTMLELEDGGLLDCLRTARAIDAQMVSIADISNVSEQDRLALKSWRKQ